MLLNLEKSGSPKKGTLKNLLSAKSIFFYPGIVMSAGWTLLNILKMASVFGSLTNEYPECTIPNPNRWAIFIPTIIALVLFKSPIERTATRVFNRILPLKKFPADSEIRTSKAHMLGERIFRLFINIACVGLLYKILL